MAIINQVLNEKNVEQTRNEVFIARLKKTIKDFVNCFLRSRTNLYGNATTIPELRQEIIKFIVSLRGKNSLNHLTSLGITKEMIFIFLDEILIELQQERIIFEPKLEKDGERYVYFTANTW